METRLLLLSTDLYPDVKRGGAVFATNCYHMFKRFKVSIDVFSLRRSTFQKESINPPITWVDIPWQIKGKLSFLLALPIYLLLSILRLLKRPPHFTIANGAYDALPPLLTGKPFAIVIHDASPFEIGILSRPILFLAMRRANLIITPSHSTADFLSQYTKKRKFILNNFLTSQKFERITTAKPDPLFERYPELRDKKVILFIGSLSEHKGAFNLIKAMKTVQETLPNAYLVIVGPNPKKKDLEEGIIQVGPLPDKAVNSYLAAADLFVLPSKRWEGFGIALLEALASGTPVIAGDLRAFKEVAGDSALYVDGGKPEKIAEAIRRVLSNPKLARKMVKKGENRASRLLMSNVKSQYKAFLDFIKGKDLN